MANRKICLDAGHYGKYNRSPAVSSYYESEMTWKLHLLLKKYLEQYGIEVITTRANQTKDLALETRGKTSKGCDLFLSIHSNAIGGTVNETVDYPLACCCVNGKADTLGLKLAQCIQSTMGTKQTGRIIKKALTSGKDYYGVLRGAASVGVTGILLEHSFHTNTKATSWLLIDSNLDKLAKAEAGVIAEYFGLKRVEDIKPLSEKPCRLHIGFASQGDIKTIKTKIAELGIGAKSDEGYIITDEMSKGDQVTIIVKCKELGIGCKIYEEPKQEEPKQEEKELPIEEVSIAKGLSVSNSSGKNVDVNNLLRAPLSFDINSDEPQILIVHTHTTESYTDSGKTKYTASDSDRSTDSSKNMIAVGNALAEVLNNRGIKTIHDTTVHDFPAYNGSYERCKATVLKNLSKYPSIKIVLDVHRDGIVRADGTKVKVSSEVEGNKTAQCMFVVGTNSELTHDNWQENMKLAVKIQNKANEMYPNFMRPINLRSERFNQQLSKGSIIIEVGSNGNTLNEAIYSAKLMGNVISKLFEK